MFPCGGCKARQVCGTLSEVPSEQAAKNAAFFLSKVSVLWGWSVVGCTITSACYMYLCFTGYR